MQEKWPDDFEGELPVGSRGPAALQLIAIRALSSRLPNENLKEDDPSVQRLSSPSTRLKLVKEFRDVLRKEKAGVPQPPNASEFPNGNPPGGSPITPAPILTPAASSPVAPAVALNPAPANERKSFAWPWAIGIAALILIVALVLKLRA